MASEPERVPVDDDIVVVDGNGRPESEEITQGGEEWPVSDLYYVGPEDGAPQEDDEAGTDEGPLVATTATADAPARRRFPPDVGVGGMLAVLGVVAALIIGALLLGLDNDEPTAAGQAPSAPTATTPPAETAPTPPASANVEVADVEGMTLAEAREALVAQDLRVRVSRSPSERPRSEVLSQAPPAGANVGTGTVVALVVSARDAGAAPAPSRVEVPEVVGLAVSDAVSALRDAGLEARIRQVTSPERRGTVVDQSPGESTEVADGSTVQLEVAKPPAKPAVTRVQVPDVVGSNAASARSELRAAGFKVTTASVASQEPAGTVIEQSPGAGTELRKGATVRLTVSSGPAQVEVPDVTGLDEAAARSELERAGFVVRVTDESITDPAQDGIIVRQTPSGGSSAQDGAVVTLVVGRLG